MAALRERRRALHGGDEKLLEVDFSARAPGRSAGLAEERADAEAAPPASSLSRLGFDWRAGRFAVHAGKTSMSLSTAGPWKIAESISR